MTNKKLQSLEDLYLHELRDIYSAEKQITKALPKLAKAATASDLKQAFEDHLEETEGQIQRLEQIFKRLGESPTGPKCKGMEGLLTEGEEFIKDPASDQVHDAGMIVAAQKVEHYEIAAYGSLCTFAKLLGYDADLELLKENIDQEEQADEKLTGIAESHVNESTEEDSEEEVMETTRGRSKR